MTVSTEISSNEYTGNGLTTDFDYKFRIFKAEHLSVTTSDADGDNLVSLRLGTDYTVTGVNKSAGGKVVLNKPLANGHKISIARELPITQETSFRNQSKFFAETHEDAFDYLTMILQRIWGSLGSLYLKRPNILANWFDAKGYRIANLGKPKRDSDAVDLGTLSDEIRGVNSTISKKEKRSLRVDDMDIAVLPKASERSGNVLTFDKDGQPIVVAPASGSAVDVLNQLANGNGSLIGIGFGTLRDNIYFVTPEQFASSMNGSDDWAIAINAALDYMESIGGGIVQLKPRHYFHRAQILVPESCTLRGCGKFSSTISAYDDMPAELNSITSKNNPMNTVKANGTDLALESFNYINGVNIEDLTVNANATGRHALISDGISELQSCGIKLTSVKQSAIRRCFVYDSIMHCYDVAASNYFDDGNTTHNINGGSYDVLIEDCEGWNSLYDDIITTHNSDKILIKNCVASNNGANPYMVWGNNQHGFEIDEGSSNVTVIDCKAIGLMCGFQAKGHDTTLAARGVKFIRCHAKDNRWSYMITHTARTLSTIVGDDVLIQDCTSENPHHDPNKTYNNNLLPINNPIYRPRHVWQFGYDNVKIRDITIIGGEGLIEIGYPDTMTPAADIKGVYWSGGYNGIYKGNDAYGLIYVWSDYTSGKHKFKKIIIKDRVSNPVIRCVDTKLAKGIVIDDVKALGENNCPCILTSLNIPSDISNIDSTGFAYAMIDSSLPGSRAKNYSNETEFSVVNGVVHLVINTAPDGDIHPARVGNTAINIATGVQYRANFNNNALNGQWVQSSI